MAKAVNPFYCQVDGRSILAPLLAAGREVRYLNSGKDNKQQTALEIAARDGIVEGPICALTAVELFSSYAIRINPQKQCPELAITPRKCLFLYHYWMHPVFGFMSIRLQSWFPFTVRIYLNGREWLARQMDRAGIAYRRHDNCFTWVEQVSQAQKLLNCAGWFRGRCIRGRNGNAAGGLKLPLSTISRFAVMGRESSTGWGRIPSSSTTSLR